ncbi:MAG: penicillin-binding protein 2 [Patescibacteria group bacterium]|jgi:penicillin-binding protein 2
MVQPNPFEILSDSNFGKSKIIKSYKSFEFSDSTLESKNSDSPTLKQQFLPSRIKLVGYLFLILIIILLVRGFWLQLAKGIQYRDSAENNRLRIVSTPSPRGIIFDRNGKKLVENIGEFTLGIIPADLQKDPILKEKQLLKISKNSKIPVEEILQPLKTVKSTSTDLLTIKEHINYDEALKLKINFKDETAVKVEVTPRRHYLDSLIFSQLIGYTAKISDQEWAKLSKQENNDYRFNDLIGKTGLEYFYENQLRGISGKSSVEVNAQKREQKIIAAEDPVPGKNLVLTVDSNLQKLLYDAANSAVKNSKNFGATVVAIDPRDGGVLAMVSVPGYDNNAFVSGITQENYKKLVDDPKKPLYFRAIAGEYPSGSTIKPVIAIAALDQGIITPQTTVLSTGGIKIDKWFFPDWKAGGHGVTNVYKAIADSVNTFFYTIGGGTESFDGLGIDRMTQYARAFGLGSQTGIDLPGERPGFLPSKAWKEQTKGEAWYIGDTYHFAIGQGDLLVTPLQMALTTATVANGGVLYKPHLAKNFQDNNGNIIQEVQPEIIRKQIAKPEDFKVVQAAMRLAVSSGSARGLQALSVPACGKTGTAQFGNANKTHAWFIGFAPCENSEIAIAVLVEGGGEGNVQALPIARKGFEYWFSQANKNRE